MRIIRAPRQAHFTIIPNETARDRNLSYRAAGLLVELLSHEDGWETNAERLAARAKEGRDAIRKALNELEAHHYMSRKKQRTPQGTWVWTQFVFDVPQPKSDTDPDRAHLSVVDNSDEAKSKAPVDSAPAPVQPVDKAAKAQVSPATDNPLTVLTPSPDNPSPESPTTVDQGAADQSPVRRQRIPRAQKEASPKKTNKNTPPPEVPHANIPGGTIDPVEVGIQEVLRRLPSSLQPRSAGQSEAIRDALIPHLLAGWTPEQIIERAAFEPIPQPIHSPAGFVRQRLATLALPPTTRQSLPWCGECDEKNRWREELDTGRPFKCPVCHPSLALGNVTQANGS